MQVACLPMWHRTCHCMRQEQRGRKCYLMGMDGYSKMGRQCLLKIAAKTTLMLQSNVRSVTQADEKPWKINHERCSPERSPSENSARSRFGCRDGVNCDSVVPGNVGRSFQLSADSELALSWCVLWTSETCCGGGCWSHEDVLYSIRPKKILFFLFLFLWGAPMR